MKPFDEAHAAQYDQAFAKLASWADGLRLATRFALADVPQRAHVLCVGAGTGAELLYLADAFPAWRFTALDPSGPMLARCRARAKAAGISERCSFHEGFLESLERGPTFDAATALLVSQFVRERDRRIDFFRQIHRRLRPGAPVVTADLSMGPSHQDQRLLPSWAHAWRFAGMPEERVRALLDGRIREMISIVSTEDYAGLLVEAGWQLPMQIFQAVMMHGFTATA